PPAEHKAYVHRSGRTARAGASGVAITVQTSAQAADVAAMMRRASVIPLRATVRPGSELLRSIAGPPAVRTAPAARPPAAPARRPVPVTDQADASGAAATGRGAAAMSAGFRGRRRR